MIFIINKKRDIIVLRFGFLVSIEEERLGRHNLTMLPAFHCAFVLGAAF